MTAAEQKADPTSPEKASLLPNITAQLFAIPTPANVVSPIRIGWGPTKKWVVELSSPQSHGLHHKLRSSLTVQRAIPQLVY
jgi:hypothetical protein